MTRRARRTLDGRRQDERGRAARPTPRRSAGAVALACLALACGEAPSSSPSSAATAPPPAPPPPPLECAAGTADCDGDRANACEVELARAPSHCGACGRACDDGLACVDGECVGRRAAQACLGDKHACVIREGRAWCWGLNTERQCGVLASGLLRPRPVEGVVELVEIACGDWHTCARRADGAVLCWGDNQHGQLGAEPSVPPTSWRDMRETPQTVPGLGDDVAQIAAGQGYTCARHRSGRVSCWGRNDLGSLGDGGSASRHTPAPVTGVEDAVHVIAGAASPCVLRADRTVWCWGSMLAGDEPRRTPRAVGVEGALEIEQGITGGCARVGGRVQCWDRDPARPPRPVPDLDDAESLAMPQVGLFCARARRAVRSCASARAACAPTRSRTRPASTSSAAPAAACGVAPPTAPSSAGAIAAR
ncbi:MAG: hypothetical protein M5U28_44995 [Sandaracinaceae bacterium]|nr:hypothetical protein [Sandaracinaceae bacterium]